MEDRTKPLEPYVDANGELHSEFFDELMAVCRKYYVVPYVHTYGKIKSVGDCNWTPNSDNALRVDISVHFPE